MVNPVLRWKATVLLGEKVSPPCDQLLERHPAAHPWLSDLEPTLGLRGVTDPRTPALLLQVPMSLRPGWRFLGILNPMDHGGLIAPLRLPGHYPAMHARLHKGPHGRFVTPKCPGPEGAIGVAKDRDGEASNRSLSLASRANGLNKEPRQVVPRPNPEPSDGREGHRPIICLPGPPVNLLSPCSWRYSAA
jgi:hypothetical protein